MAGRAGKHGSETVDFPKEVRDWVKNNPDEVELWMTCEGHRKRVLNDPDGYFGHDSMIAKWVHERIADVGKGRIRGKNDHIVAM